MRSVYVSGVAMTKFDRHWETSLEHLGARAVIGALSDGDIHRDKIDAAYVGHMSQGEVVGQRILRELDFPPIPVTNVENACASGGTALREAWIAVAAGIADTVLVLGIEKMAKRGLLALSHRSMSQKMGQVIPGSYALAGVRHMAEFGTTREQFAKISVKNHDHGAANPLAMFQDPCTLDQVLESRVIAEPVTLLQCSAPSSGAAAVVLSAKPRGKRHVQIRACELVAEMNRGLPEDFTAFGTTKVAADRAYAKAGVGPQDLDVVELHDAFTVGELIHYECLGLCPHGEGGSLVDSGATRIGGRIPVNPSGGLLSRGHPTGATGIAQVVELVWQFRGCADKRQVEGATVGLAQCQGGSGRGNGAATVTILSC